MAAVSRAVVCQDGDYRMTNKTNNLLTPVAQEAGGLAARTNKTPVGNQPGRPPVRVKLRRINANFAKAYPPDGDSKVWCCEPGRSYGGLHRVVACGLDPVYRFPDRSFFLVGLTALRT
jgi:hypothetical protein